VKRIVIIIIFDIIIIIIIIITLTIPVCGHQVAFQGNLRVELNPLIKKVPGFGAIIATVRRNIIIIIIIIIIIAIRWSGVQLSIGRRPSDIILECSYCVCVCFVE
jgi:hypothetical protein